MNYTLRAKHANIFIGAAVIVVVLGGLSAIDAPNRTYTGFGMDGMHRVNTVETGSPAARAGIQVGDILKSVNGVLVTDTKAELSLMGTSARWHDLVFDRGAQAVHLEIAPEPVPARFLYLSGAATLVGLCFVGFPLWAYLAAPGRPTTLLAASGLTFGATILGAPDFQSPTITLAVFAAMWVLAFLGAAALLHFLLAFPSPPRFLTRRWGALMLYAPVAALVLRDAIAVMRQREAAGALGDSLILFFGVYFLATIGLLVWRYATTSPANRTAHGLRFMLRSVVIVLVLLPVYAVVTNVSPTVAALLSWLPWEYFALAVVAVIPIAFSLAAVKSARSDGRDDCATV